MTLQWKLKNKYYSEADNLAQTISLNSCSKKNKGLFKNKL
jgi:hypothetical protein